MCLVLCLVSCISCLRLLHARDMYCCFLLLSAAASSWKQIILQRSNRLLLLCSNHYHPLLVFIGEHVLHTCCSACWRKYNHHNIKLRCPIKLGLEMVLYDHCMIARTEAVHKLNKNILVYIPHDTTWYDVLYDTSM